jgi:uncharacterized repeat protein (TIGR04138 family)
MCKMSAMPPSDDQTKEKANRQLRRLVDVGLYPGEAYDFVQQGLFFTVQKIHGAEPTPGVSRHINGADLCHGLREYAASQWGYLARTVLARWNITSTLDFGTIVFSLIEIGHMQKTDQDTIDDFRNIYDFRAAFERDYRIEGAP